MVIKFRGPIVSCVFFEKKSLIAVNPIYYHQCCKSHFEFFMMSLEFLLINLATNGFLANNVPKKFKLSGNISCHIILITIFVTLNNLIQH